MELWCHPLCSPGGESFSPMIQYRLIIWNNPSVLPSSCLLVKFMSSGPFFLPPCFVATAGSSSFWPWQFAPAPGEGEEWGVSHAPFYPSGLPVSAQGHDWGQPWKEAHGKGLWSQRAQTSSPKFTLKKNTLIFMRQTIFNNSFLRVSSSLFVCSF